MHLYSEIEGSSPPRLSVAVVPFFVEIRPRYLKTWDHFEARDSWRVLVELEQNQNHDVGRSISLAILSSEVTYINPQLEV